ncbi:PapD-like protein [Gamsiella multidivaricata]|uniref:PapD-like protein n=1 Tax=Gamsiella multidivaricata TaxID=101098 RepID=UPI00222061BB|nr:PapD-like protein [Gamsiella multidivaricata]KAG0370420.1 phosphatidylinositol-binding protein scs2 [Gamsiella multidivaricata]KAI7827090.1 PapD-like protein [Gamsiella multidivaricata]
MSIELEPSAQLGFRRPLTEPIKESLIIRNPTQLPIAFKVKTTAPKQYCVRPNSGRVEAGEELEVQVQMQAMKEDPPIDFRCKDKFLVQSVAITAEREQLSPQDLWPTIEREARDQIREKKIRCAFLPPIEHEITQIKEEDELTSSRVSSATHSTHSTINSHTVPAPASPVHHVAPTSTIAAAPGLPLSNSSSAAASGADVSALRHELEAAHETIRSLQSNMEKLQSEASTLRQRKPEAGSSSAPMMTAVHLKHQQEGYPISYLAGAAVIAFLFAYLFF